MFDYFQSRKEEIGDYLKALFEQKGEELGRVNPLGPDLCERLYAFALRGKMIRGGLVSLGFAVARGPGSSPAEGRTVTAAGAAMELLQSGLLVHDDIMDRDATRRGLQSIFSQYVGLADEAGIADSYHLGESLGICAGDVAYFLAFEILGRTKVPPSVHRDILSLAARELGYVGVAQMQDVYAGAAGTVVRDDEILRLYLYKTGRYTFSLPLMVGGLIGRARTKVVATLERLGEALGIIFQIKDDEIGLFGVSEETGKPEGSDIKEGKKTLYYGRLFRQAAAGDLERLGGIFGNPRIGDQEVAYVRELTEGLGIRREIQEKADGLADSARSLIDGLVEPGCLEREILYGLLDYSLARTR